MNHARFEENLLGLLRCHGVATVGQHRALRDLAADWAATGLRRADLFTGLDRLENAGCVRMDHPADDVVVMLEPAGDLRLRHLEGATVDPIAFAAPIVAGRRKTGPTVTGRHRRATDVAVGRGRWLP